MSWEQRWRRPHHVSGRGGASGCEPRRGGGAAVLSAPAQRSLLAPVLAGASSRTAAAAAQGAGGQRRDGTSSRDQGKGGRGRQREGGHPGQEADQVRAGRVAFRVGVNADEEVVGTMGRQRVICSGVETR